MVETPGRKGGRGQGEGWDSEFERLCLLGELREWACEWVCRWIGTALICSSAGCANGCADGTALQLSVRAVVLCVVTRVVVPIGLSSSGGVCAGADATTSPVLSCSPDMVRVAGGGANDSCMCDCARTFPVPSCSSYPPNCSPMREPAAPVHATSFPTCVEGGWTGGVNVRRQSRPRLQLPNPWDGGKGRTWEGRGRRG